MNGEERTAELKKELATLSARYGFKKIIMLVEEEKGSRVNIYANQENVELDEHSFALFYESCLKISKTLREISNHMADHIMNKVLGGSIKDQVMEERLRKGVKKHAD